MRIIIQGNNRGANLEDLLTDAIDNTMKLISKDSPELYKDITDNVERIDCSNVIVDLEFKLKGQDDPVVLTANHGNDTELLTFIYDVNEDCSLELKKYNNDDAGQDSMFTKEEHAVYNINNGLAEVEEKLDVTGINVVYENTFSNITVFVYENGYVKYYNTDGKLVQETTVKSEDIEDFIQFLKDNLEGNRNE